MELRRKANNGDLRPNYSVRRPRALWLRWGCVLETGWRLASQGPRGPQSLGKAATEARNHRALTPSAPTALSERCWCIIDRLQAFNILGRATRPHHHMKSPGLQKSESLQEGGRGGQAGPGRGRAGVLVCQWTVK